jgi:hypothetical protein
MDDGGKPGLLRPNRTTTSRPGHSAEPPTGPRHSAVIRKATDRGSVVLSAFRVQLFAKTFSHVRMPTGIRDPYEAVARIARLRPSARVSRENRAWP